MGNVCPRSLIRQYRLRPGLRVGFLCASAAQRDRVAATLKKALERRVVELNLFPSDNKQRESILEAAYTIRCLFLPGEGPRNVIVSAENSTAEATEALQGITIATPGDHDNAARSATGGGKDGKMKFSGRAAEQRKLKMQKKHEAKRL